MRPLIWLIAGTSEGRGLIRELGKLPVELYVSVATEYGAKLIEPQPHLTVMAERKNLEAMRSFLKAKSPVCVVDATHPYATIVTETIQQACAAENCRYLRMVRPVLDAGDALRVQSFEEAVEFLNQVEGNIFLTTGSKNLKDFTGVQNYQERISLRVLPMESSLHTALELGYKGSNVVCMQGPFSQEMDIAMFRKFQAKYVVTKDTGKAGGFDDKVAAAAAVGAKLVVIGRATEEHGADYEGMVHLLKKEFGA